jgi:large subunit ribosomal protein L20
MARVKRGTKRRARRKKYLRRTKGFFLTKSKLYQSAQEAANRADRYAYRDRRARKRQFRRLWIQRIGAAARLNGLSYSELMHGLKTGGISPCETPPLLPKSQPRPSRQREPRLEHRVFHIITGFRQTQCATQCTCSGWT